MLLSRIARKGSLLLDVSTSIEQPLVSADPHNTLVAMALTSAAVGCMGSYTSHNTSQHPVTPTNTLHKQDMSSSALAEFKKDPWQWQRQRMMLPEITLAGPVELVFSRITDLSLWLPHSTDVPRARRLLVAPGAALTLRQLKGISLRKPVELPDLPPSYVAGVLLKGGETGKGSSGWRVAGSSPVGFVSARVRQHASPASSTNN